MKCVKCGANNFFVDEARIWDAEIVDGGVLECTGADIGEVLKVICCKCGKVYFEKSFKAINFS